MLARLDLLDKRLSERLAAPLRRPHNRWLAGAVVRFSQAGSYGVGWIGLFLVVAAIDRGLVVALVATACVAATLALNTAIKLAVRRPRPATELRHAPTSHSFPSAHTSMAVVGAALMSHLVPGLTVAWWALAALLAVSRVLIGVHYLGDVIAGALFGAALAPLAVSLVLQLGS